MQLDWHHSFIPSTFAHEPTATHAFPRDRAEVVGDETVEVEVEVVGVVEVVEVVDVVGAFVVVGVVVVVEVVEVVEVVDVVVDVVIDTEVWKQLNKIVFKPFPNYF